MNDAESFLTVLQSTWLAPKTRELFCNNSDKSFVARHHRSSLDAATHQGQDSKAMLALDTGHDGLEAKEEKDRGTHCVPAFPFLEAIIVAS